MIHRVAIGLAALLFGALVLRLARRDRLLPTAAAWWLGGAALLLVFGVASELVCSGVAVFGLELPPHTLLYFAFAFLALRALYIDMDRARSELCLRRLVRRHVHLELRLREVDQALAARGMPLPEHSDKTEEPDRTCDGASMPDC